MSAKKHKAGTPKLSEHYYSRSGIRQLVGHAEPQVRLLACLRAGMFPAGLLLTGQAGVGKYALARLAAASFLGAEIVSEEYLHISERDPVVMKMDAGGHPDFRALHPEQATPTSQPVISVAGVREAVGFLQMTAAGEKGTKCVVIDRAETMNVSAQNALLKALEEPTGRAAFILVSSKPQALTATVRSRCIRMNVPNLLPEECTRVLAFAAPASTEEARAKAAAAARHSPGVALRLLSADLSDMRVTLWHALRTGYQGGAPEWPKACESAEMWDITLAVLARMQRDLSMPDALLPQDFSEEERACREAVKAGGEIERRRLHKAYEMAARRGASLYLDKAALLRNFFCGA